MFSSHTFEQLIFEFESKLAIQQKKMREQKTNTTKVTTTTTKNTRDLKWLSGTRVKSELWYTAIIIIYFWREIIICYCIEASRARVVVPVSRIQYTHMRMIVCVHVFVSVFSRVHLISSKRYIYVNPSTHMLNCSHICSLDNCGKGKKTNSMQETRRKVNKFRKICVVRTHMYECADREQ